MLAKNTACCYSFGESSPPVNTIYYGDNLNIIRRYIRDESVDLVYLDPPFNSNRNYNVLFKDESGLEADSREWLSADTWHWKGAASTYDDLILEGDKVVVREK